MTAYRSPRAVHSEVDFLNLEQFVHIVQPMKVESQCPEWAVYWILVCDRGRVDRIDHLRNVLIES